MRQLRRLDPKPRSAFASLHRGSLRSASVLEHELAAIERERPELIAARGDALLVAQPARQTIFLNYAFPDRDAFARSFAEMFNELLPAIEREDAPFGVSFRLREMSQRAYVEPVLRSLAFEVRREWMEMDLLDLPQDGAPRDEIAPGLTLRPVRPDDAEGLVELETLAFPTPELTVQQAGEAIETAETYRVLEEQATGAIAGSIMLVRVQPATGYVANIAVHVDRQQRGLGEGLMRWALAYFVRQGMRNTKLTVNTDNAPAIALYRKLGFADVARGLDYYRPIVEDEVRQVLEKNRAEHIRVRRRWT